MLFRSNKATVSTARNLNDSTATPASNTGLIPHNRFVSSVDTLTLMLSNVPTDKAAVDIQHLIERTFGEAIDFSTSRSTFMMVRWDGCSRGSLRGTMLHWKNPRGSRPGRLRIHLPGKAIAAAGQEELRDFAAVVCAIYKGRATRIDLACDDFDRLTNFDDLADAQRNRNYVGVRSHRVTRSGGLSEEDGVTYYFGAKSSDTQLRVYDKWIESRHKINCIRWELQLRRAKAAEACAQWVVLSSGAAEHVAGFISGCIAGAVDFIDRSAGHKDLSRCERLPWWERLRSCMGEARKIVVEPPIPLMAAKLAWVCKSVMPSLATIKKYLGTQAFWQFCEDGILEKGGLLSRLNLSLIEQAQKEDRESNNYVEYLRKLENLDPYDNLSWKTISSHVAA